RTNLGFGDGYGDTQGLPFFQNFFAGGLSSGGGTVRGFDENSLGPRSTPPRQYATAPGKFARDSNGNIMLYESGAPMQTLPAYQTVPVVDAAGQPVLGPDGNQLLQLATQDIAIRRRLDSFGGNLMTVGS